MSQTTGLLTFGPQTALTEPPGPFHVGRSGDQDQQQVPSKHGLNQTVGHREVQPLGEGPGDQGLLPVQKLYFVVFTFLTEGANLKFEPCMLKHELL